MVAQKTAKRSGLSFNEVKSNFNQYNLVFDRVAKGSGYEIKERAIVGKSKKVKLELLKKVDNLQEALDWLFTYADTVDEKTEAQDGSEAIKTNTQEVTQAQDGSEAIEIDTQEATEAQEVTQAIETQAQGNNNHHQNLESNQPGTLAPVVVYCSFPFYPVKGIEKEFLPYLDMKGDQWYKIVCQNFEAYDLVNRKIITESEGDSVPILLEDWEGIKIHQVYDKALEPKTETETQETNSIFLEKVFRNTSIAYQPDQTYPITDGVSKIVELFKASNGLEIAHLNQSLGFSKTASQYARMLAKHGYSLQLLEGNLYTIA